jgi:hypothetical protein
MESLGESSPLAPPVAGLAAGYVEEGVKGEFEYVEQVA